MDLFKKKFFILLLFLGTFITISSSSWFSSWLGLEINLIAFIPMIFNYSQISEEASFKYFLTQAAGSIIFILASLSLSMKVVVSPPLNPSELLIFPLLMALLLKMGASPFHFWFPAIINGLSWNNSLLLFTWQKLAPLSILPLLSLKNNLLLIFSVWPSLIVGAIGGFNQSSLKKILAYSSIAHLGWMLTAIHLSHKMFLIYFSIYSFILVILTLAFSKMEINNLPQLFMFSSTSSLASYLIMLNMLSLGGLPPFLGFFPKWMIFMSTISSSLITSTLMIISSLTVLFYYLRITLQSLLFAPTTYKITFLSHPSLISNYFSMTSILFFLLIPFVA